MDGRSEADPELGTLSIKQLIDLGEMGLQLGYPEQAERYFDAVLLRVPQHPSALLGKAKACGEPRTALAAVEQLLAVRPANHEAQALASGLRDRLSADELAASARPHPAATSPLDESITAPPTPQELAVLASLSQVGAVGSTGSVGSPPTGHQGLRDWAYLALYALWPFRRGSRRKSVLTIYLLVTTVISLAGAWSLFRVADVPTLRQQDLVGMVELLVGQLTPDDEPLATLLPTAVEVPTLESGALDRAARATAQLTVPSLDGSMVQGSGILLTTDGLVLTNYHVMTAGGQQLANPEGLAFVGLTSDVRQPPSDWYIAALVASDPTRDLAVLRTTHTVQGRLVRGDHFVPMSEAPADAIEMGQPVIGLGYPALGGATLTLTRGSMAGFARQGDTQLGKTDTELLPGSSGGAVLNAQGQLVGVITSVLADERTVGRLSYFILLSEAHDLVQEAAQQPRPHPDIRPMLSLYAQLAPTDQ